MNIEAVYALFEPSYQEIEELELGDIFQDIYSVIAEADLKGKSVIYVNLEEFREVEIEALITYFQNENYLVSIAEMDEDTLVISW